MCMTCDLSYLNTSVGRVRTPTARYLAQWAVNAVDAKARDSIMTEFDYDPLFANSSASLSTGWVPAGGTAGGTCTVFGCKRPDLLITETLAFHDRRTQDTNQEVVEPN